MCIRDSVKNRVYYEYYHLDGTQEVPADYKEISFVCLRPDGSLEPVSYTHLDVYKRQLQHTSWLDCTRFFPYLNNWLTSQKNLIPPSLFSGYRLCLLYTSYVCSSTCSSSNSWSAKFYRDNCTFFRNTEDGKSCLLYTSTKSTTAILSILAYQCIIYTLPKQPVMVIKCRISIESI